MLPLVVGLACLMLLVRPYQGRLCLKSRDEECLLLQEALHSDPISHTTFMISLSLCSSVTSVNVALEGQICLSPGSSEIGTVHVGDLPAA